MIERPTNDQFAKAVVLDSRGVDIVQIAYWISAAEEVQNKVEKLREKEKWLDKVESALDDLYLFIKPDGNTNYGHAMDRITVIAAEWRKLQKTIKTRSNK